jgi:hypothetical protein
MTARPIPNLRRDLPISVALLILAAAAVVPSTIAVIISLAAITSLIFLRVTMGHIATPRRGGFRDDRSNPMSEGTSSSGGSHATHAA